MFQQDIKSKTILDLSRTPKLLDSSVLMLQRLGSLKAENSTFLELVDYIVSHRNFGTSVENVTTQTIKAEILEHKKESDPHGDRAYATSLMTNHLANKDPHGDKAYTDKVMDTHKTLKDPHGDRDFTTKQILAHSNSDDPHGDREYTDSKVIQHSSEVDPHGDRSYTDIALGKHKIEVDPHGDRVYSDQKLNAHNTLNNAHGFQDKINTAFLNHNQDPNAHDIDRKINDVVSTLDGLVLNSFNQSLGTTVAPLEFGKVPDKYLTAPVEFHPRVQFPSLGKDTILYVDTTSQSLFIWNGSSYIPVSGSSSSNGEVLTTDSIAEGLNQDRKYFTKEKSDLLDSKVTSVVTRNVRGSGIDLISSNIDDPKVVLKSIQAEGSIQIRDTEEGLVWRDNIYPYYARLDGDVKLTTNSSILKDLDTNDLILMKGNILAYTYQDAGNTRLLVGHKLWSIDAILATTGTSESITAPTNMVISSNGLVITGKSIPTATVEVYTESNNLLGSAVTITDGTFTVVLTSAQLQGNQLKLYTITTDGSRSAPSYMYSANTTNLKDTDAISITNTGNTIRGNSARGAVITLTNNSTNKNIGTGTCDDFGNFSIAFTTPVKTGDTIRITSKLGTSLTKVIESYSVQLPSLIPPHSITYNLERTVLSGKAEKNSRVEMRIGSKVYKSNTDSSGVFTIYDFTNPIKGGEETIFEVIDQDRKASMVINMQELPSKSLPDPLVTNKIVSMTTSFTTKDIKVISGDATEVSLDLNYNTFTNELEIVGKNASKLDFIWTGDLNIIKHSTDGD